MQVLINFIGSILNWILDLLLYIPKKGFELLTDGIAALGSSIPAPDFLVGYSGYISGLAGGVLWFLDMTAASQGLAMVISALLARFALKLIPTLGF